MALTISKQPALNSLQLALSPILVQAVSTNSNDDNFKYQCEVYIWSGAPADEPSTASYTLEKSPNGSISNNVIFNISGLLMSEFDEVEPSTMIDRTEYILNGGKWAKVVIKGIGDSTETRAGNRFFVTRGYNLMSREEINGSNGWSSGEQVIVRPEYSTIYSEHAFYVPIIRDGNSLIYVKDDQGTDYTASLTGSAGNSSQRVEYVDVMDILKRELSATSSTLTYRTTSDTADEITFNVGCEPKYDTIPVMYLNRYGVWETLFMSKKKTRTMTYNRVNYKRSAFVDSYDLNMSRKMSVSTASVETKFTLNSDFLDEEENAMYEDLLLSTYVCIKIDGKWRQVVVDDTQFTEKTHLNDRLIRHSITFTQGFSDVNMIQ